jgi:hypothetical protein
MECGSKIIDARCPNCDLNQEWFLRIS